MSKAAKAAGRILRIIGRIILWIFIVLISLLVICGVVNKIMQQGEKDLLKDDRCHMVEVDGKNMSIYTEGSGEHTIVLMSGWGTPSPMYDFRPLYEKLSDDCKIAVLEKFGYGFSDKTDGERDIDTLVRQDREALQKAGIEAPYVLCPHSLSGLEATYWAQMYPDEVEAIIGLDMSTSVLMELESDNMLTFEKVLGKTVALSGINRPMLALSDLPECRNAKEKKQYIAVYSANDGNSTVLREADSQKANCEKIKSLPLPKTPTLQFISGTNRDNERWVDSHREMTDASSHGRMVQLDCGHYVHHYESEKIAKEIRSFLSELKK